MFNLNMQINQQPSFGGLLLSFLMTLLLFLLLSVTQQNKICLYPPLNLYRKRRETDTLLERESHKLVL